MQNSLGITQDEFRQYYIQFESDDVLEIKNELWYIADISKGDYKSDLCHACRHIDFRYFLENHVKINRGPYFVLEDMVAHEKECNFCRLVVGSLCHDDGTAILGTERDGEYVICQLSSEEKHPRATSYHICLWRRRLFHRDMLSSPVLLQELTSVPMPFGGRSVPPQPDFLMLRRWLHRCESNHEPLEQHEGVPSCIQSRDPETLLRAIDVVDACIVILPAARRYLALSYVWGGVKGLELTKSNLEALMCRKSLATEQNRNRIPKTIQDACSLVVLLGERYLWVDSLCIIQDDSDKYNQIKNMHHTYENATLTIVVAYGNHSNSGIPGVRVEQSTRIIRQVQEHVDNNLTLASRLPDITIAVDESVWNCRGWTYQERVLSQRVLYMTEDQIYFQCNHGATFSEDVVEEDDEESLVTMGQVEEITPGAMNVLQPRNTPPVINFHLYTIAVKSYTSRNTSFQSDALNAFAGLLQCLKPRFRSDFVFGLPETELDMAILWLPMSSGKLRRDDSDQSLFPTWSWTGWNGKVDYLWTVTEVLPRLTWKDFSSNTYISMSTFRSPIDDPTEFASTWIRSTSDAIYESFHESHNSSRRFLHPTASEEKRIPRQFIQPRSAGVLGVRALCAQFFVSDRHVSDTTAILLCNTEEHRLCALEVHNEAGYCVGTLQIPSYFTSRMCNTTRDFILLSRTRLTSDPCDPQDYPSVTNELVDPIISDTEASLSEDGVDELDCIDFDTSRYDPLKPWCIYNVMLIETQDEISHRVALGRLHVDAFLEANPTYREVLLG